MEVNVKQLLKIEIDSKTNLFVTIVFWSIYKVILDRNKTGTEKRSFVLKHVFVREIKKNR